MTLRRVGACSLGETTELANYLAHTDVPYYAQLLRARAGVASLVEFVDRRTLGEAWTIFGELGGIRAPSTVERAKFLVREARAIWTRPDCGDRRGRERLEDLVAAERAAGLCDRRITFALTTSGPVIVDGNKRAIAIHEVARAALVLSAFLIESAPGYPPLPMP